MSFVLLLLCVASGAADPSDPFARVNRAKPKPSPASVELAKLIDFKVSVEPRNAKPGELVRLTIAGVLKEGHYTYPLTQRSPQQNDSALVKITIEDVDGLKALEPWHESKPDFVINQLNEIFLEHIKPFSWSQDILVLPHAQPGLKEFDIAIRLQVCNKSTCLPGVYPLLEASFEVMPDPNVKLSAGFQDRIAAKPPAIRVVEPPTDLAEEARKRAVAQSATPGKSPTGGGDSNAANVSTLGGLAWAAFVGAFLMLLTPCVFPMIPITVNFFLKQSEKEHHKPFFMASVYSATIVVLLTAAMLTLGKLVIDWANNAWFNLALGAVLVLFALSLFGMFELQLPASLARFTASHEGQGGMMGTVFMALTFTITSFTCTGPFIGLMLGAVAGTADRAPLPFWNLALASLIYSATFAAPFFVLAIFPTFLRKLPKSGGWLNTVKVTMGFLELGAALKFLANTDIAWNPGNPRLFNYDTVLCAWIALSLACGLYLIGVFRLPHDDAPGHIGVIRMMFATIFFGMTIYMFPALRGETPAGIVGEGLVAFLPPSFKEARAAPGDANGAAPLGWHKDYKDAWEEARRDKKLIFIDFTGVNCTNCRDNEKNVFPKAAVAAGLKQYARVQLYTDTVPVATLSAAEALRQAERNAGWRDHMTGGNSTNPFYVIFQPDPTEPFAEGRPIGKVVDMRNGTIWNVSDFVDFLQRPLKN